jgi:hypothetical protein
LNNVRVDIPSFDANTPGLPVALVRMSKSIRSTLFKSIDAKFNLASENYFHWNSFILNDYLK